MKNFSLIFIFIILVLSSCQFSNNSRTEKPENLIPREEMIDIMADMQIAEAYIEALRSDGKRTNDSSMVYFERIFRKHQISQATYEESMLYYKQDLEDMNGMYEAVIVRLNELKAKNDELILQMKRDSIIADSLKQLKLQLDSLISENDTIFVHDSVKQKQTGNK